MENIKLLYIDLFCGAGGTSTGVEHAKLDGTKCARVVACVNHDANAIASHQANHPDTLHFTEDIRTLDLTALTAHLNRMRMKYPSALVVLWASLECTNFSKAKGGQPRDADSRTLAEHLFRYIEQLNPDYIQIENVEEFMSWGDMDDKGHPISKLKGCSYVRWANKVISYGYHYDWRLLNAADFGAYTSRKRFFGQFAKKGLPIAFPVPTFSKNGDSGMFHAYKKWKPVREVLDMNDAGQSIFDRKKPLCEKTLKRIYAGLIKFVAGGKETFLVKYNSMNQTGKSDNQLRGYMDGYIKALEVVEGKLPELAPQTVDQDFQFEAYKYFFEEIQHMVNLEACVVKDVEKFVKTYKVPTVGVKELSTRECLDILYEVEDYFWGDRSGFDKIMHAQMVFAKELRKRIAALQPNIKTQK